MTLRAFAALALVVSLAPALGLGGVTPALGAGSGAGTTVPTADLPGAGGGGFITFARASNAAGAAEPSAEAGAATPVSAPAPTVGVPYKGKAEVSLPDGWTTTACPVGSEPSLISLSCTGNQITFVATGYSPDQVTQRVRIAATGGGAIRTLTYEVSLTAPEISGPSDFALPVVVAKGTPITVPYSNLPARCVACAGKAPTYVAGRVTPTKAGSIAFSGAGLVYYPAPGFTGNATLTFRVRDSYGGLSKASSIAATVIEGISHAPAVTPTLVRTEKDEAATGNTMAGDTAEKGYRARVSSCGAPLHGHVTCQPDGSFAYTPAPGFTGVDQFAYYVVVPSTGDETIGNVAVGVGADPAKVGGATTQREVTPVIAPADAATTPSGAFAVPYEATRDIRARIAEVRSR